MKAWMFLLFMAVASACAQTPFTIEDPAMRPSTLVNGLAGYWRLEEASGTRYDCSPNGNHLTSNNSVGQTTGKKGSCASLTAASSQYLSIADNSTIHVSGSAFTICAWVLGNTYGVTHHYIAAKATGAAPWEWELFYEHGTTRFEFNVYNNSTATQVNASNFGTPSTGVWYFVAAGYDTANNQIWISVNNGTKNTTACAITLTTNTTTFQIGAEDGNYWDGKIDELGLWKRTLTSAELTQLYNAGAGVTAGRFLK